MFKSWLKKIILNNFSKRVIRALVRDAIVHPKSERYRRHVLNAIEALEFERKELTGVVAYTSWQELLEASIKRTDPSLSVWVELGVMTGETTRKMAEYARANELSPEIHGFDSFEGLPEAWYTGVDKGAFAINEPKFSEKNITIHAGWFEDTLPAFASDNPTQIGLLHADADLYSSTKTGFDNLNIDSGTVIVFDEYWNYLEYKLHEYKAFNQFIQSSGKNFEYIGYNKQHMQLSVIIL
jgi:hypothetical protein